jgi:hypothetical protein
MCGKVAGYGTGGTGADCSVQVQCCKSDPCRAGLIGLLMPWLRPHCKSSWSGSGPDSPILTLLDTLVALSFLRCMPLPLRPQYYVFGIGNGMLLKEVGRADR